MPKNYSEKHKRFAGVQHHLQMLVGCELLQLKQSKIANKLFNETHFVYVYEVRKEKKHNSLMLVVWKT